jgi:benzoate/toluate 1,2-dioxygenase beta subunit
MQTAHDPTISSFYVTDELYRKLVANFTNWQRDELAIAAPEVRDHFRLLLEREARLLDELRFDEWLAMYAPECIYWVPGTPGGGDPRREIAICSTIAGAWKIESIACAPVTPGRRRRNPARCG